MSFGGSKNNTTTTTVELPKETKELIGLAMPGLRSYAKNPPTLPDRSAIAGFAPEQEIGQGMALDAASSQAGIGRNAANATDFLLNRALYPSTNPALQGTIDAAVRPLYENLTSQILPNIRGEAALRGQYGGSRQGVAEGIAARSTQQAAKDAASQIATEGYQSGLEGMYRGLALSPTVSDLQVAPAVTVSGVGDVRQGMAQNLLNEEYFRDMYGKNLPLYTAQELAAIGSGLPGGSTSVTAPQASGNPFSGALGGASLGAALFPAAGLAGPAGLAGAGIGALLGLF